MVLFSFSQEFYLPPTFNVTKLKLSVTGVT
jgi:hypothetical protein